MLSEYMCMMRIVVLMRTKYVILPHVFLFLLPLEVKMKTKQNENKTPINNKLKVP